MQVWLVYITRCTDLVYARASDGPGNVSMDLCIHKLCICYIYSDLVSGIDASHE